MVPSKGKYTKEYAGGNWWGAASSEDHFSAGTHGLVREEMEKMTGKRACHVDPKQAGHPERVGVGGEKG